MPLPATPPPPPPPVLTDEERQDAIEATKQFDSTNAIPVLKAVAMNTTDMDEQIALPETVKFLSLPPLAISPPEQDQAPSQTGPN